MDIIQKIYMALCESNQDHSVELSANGRYDIHHVETDPYRNSQTYHYIASKPDGAQEFKVYKHRNRVGDKSWYDPSIASLEKRDEGEPYERNVPVLNSDEHDLKIHTGDTPGLIYRGMSHEEYHGIKNSGYIKSNGQFNMDGQEGLTYFSTDPMSAQNYAHSFAPERFKASGKHNVYVVGVKPQSGSVKVAGTGEHEVGIPHAVPESDIVEVHEGRPYASHSGNQEFINGDRGSGVSPMTFVAWKRIK